MIEWTIGRQGLWKPYFYELRVDGVLVATDRFWSLNKTMFAIAGFEGL